MKNPALSIKLLTALQFGILGAALAVDSDPWRAITVFAGIPIAALSVFCIKPWSFTLFSSTLAFTGLRYAEAWQLDHHLLHPALMIMLLALDALAVAYFLLPEVHRAAPIPKTCWWDTSPRFELRLSATVVKNLRKSRASVANISKGGAFIRTSEDLDANDRIELKFAVLTQDFHLRAEVMYALKGASSGYGVRFEHTSDTLEKIRRLCYCLEVLDAKKERIDHRIIRHPFVQRIRRSFAA